MRPTGAKVADWTHYAAVTALMVFALNAVDAWPLAVLVIVAYFVAIAAETWLYGEATYRRRVAVGQ